MGEKKEHINKSSVVPEPTLRRMPIYLHFLHKAKNQGILTISAPSMAKELDYDPTQIVKDLSYTGIKGRPRIGYNIYELIQSLEHFLGYNKVNEAFLVGAGNLGSALLAYPELKSFGLKIVAAFDVNENKIGSNIGNVGVLHIDSLEEMSTRLKVKIAILTTPGSVAQKNVDLLVKCGIKAIWNLTPVKLKVPDNIIVQNTSMYANVAVLLNKLNDSE